MEKNYVSGKLPDFILGYVEAVEAVARARNKTGEGDPMVGQENEHEAHGVVATGGDEMKPLESQG